MATPAEIEKQPLAAPAPAEVKPPSGPAAALILAGGIAVFCMGLVTTLGEASTGIADGLQWNDRVGPLSGKTLITVIVFAAAWALLHTLWRRSNPPLRSITVTSAVLIVLGLVGTFPTFFQAFE
jgi:hypothetical protein